MSLPEYLRYWGCTRSPFHLTPDPGMLYLSRGHQEALLRMRYALLANKGGALLISENAGDGKTSLLRKLVEEVRREFGEGSRVAFIEYPDLTRAQMLSEIALQLGVEKPGRDKGRILARLRPVLQQVADRGERTLVIVDEGQMLAGRPDLLDELRALLNLNEAGRFLLTFILAGQAPLEPAVRGKPELWQRLPVRYRLMNLSFSDSRGLLKHRMRMAGSEREVFTDEAVGRLYQASSGCPRVLCAVADLALVLGFSQRVKQVDEPCAKQAASDMEGGGGEAFHYFHFTRALERKPDQPRHSGLPLPQGEAS
jgi:type II secretory pathway predicted ATPase ExeA